MTELHQRIRSICYSGNGRALRNLVEQLIRNHEYDTYQKQFQLFKTAMPALELPEFDELMQLADNS